MDTFTEKIMKEISVENMMETLNVFSRLYRYTGMEQGEEAVDYIYKKLKEYEVPVELENYTVYRSLPDEGILRLQTEDKRDFQIMPAVFSPSVKDQEFELVYLDVEQKNLKSVIRQYQGKAILIDHNTKFLQEWAEEVGIEAIISIWKHNYIHHTTIGTNWGTPGLRDAKRYYKVPYAEIPYQQGQGLKKQIGEFGGAVKAQITMPMTTNVLRSRMPIAAVPGSSNKFVLVSGHYDSWYEGITDNAAANAIMLEIARILYRHQKELKRGVIFGWWSGHSDARYAGSTWYCDQHWKQLKNFCMAHINIDIAGCEGSDMIVARSTMMEGRAFCENLIREYTGKPPVTHFPMYHAADQSFWGTDIPIHIMYCYERSKSFVNDMKAMPSFEWWHTPEDGLKHVDPNIVLRDCRINLDTVLQLVLKDKLQIHYRDFFEETEACLRKIVNGLPEDMNFSQTEAIFEAVKCKILMLEELSSEYMQDDMVIKKIAGKLNRIVYTYSDSYNHDDAVPSEIFPLLSECAARLKTAGSKEDELFIRTDLMRQKNRLEGELENLLEYMEYLSMR